MTIHRTEWLDWYRDDGESAVLVGDRVVVLSEAATHLVDAAVGVTVEDLAARLVAVFGAPPDGDALAAVAAMVTDLVDAGVLEESAVGSSS